MAEGIKLAARSHQNLVWVRTRHVLRLRSALREFYPRSPGKASQIVLLVLAVLTAVVGLLDMNGAAAIGLYLTLFAGVAWIVGAAWQLSMSKQASAAAEDSL